MRISPTGFSTSLLTYDSKHSTHVKCASAHEMPSAAGASQKHIVHVCEGRGGARGGQRVDAEKATGGGARER